MQESVVDSSPDRIDRALELRSAASSRTGSEYAAPFGDVL